MLIDLHVHTHHTRGCALAPRDAIRRAREAGLDGVAFTDWNTLDALSEVRAAGREEGFLALCGVEIVTDRGHYLCFFPDPEKVAAPPQMFGSATPWGAREVLEKVRALGGAAIAAHPYDKTIDRPSGDFIFTLDGLAAIEGLNVRRRGPANDLAVEAADHMGLPCTGGSGAHAVEEIGGAATLFRDPVATEADLVAQLRAGTVFCVAIGVTPGAAEAASSRRDERPGPRRGPGPGRGDDRRDGDRRGDRRGGGRGGPGHGGPGHGGGRGGRPRGR
jgi:predicted metal-dependent phosphoesterase TrpH